MRTQQAIKQQQVVLRVHRLTNEQVIAEEKRQRTALQICLWERDHRKTKYNSYQHEELYTQWFSLRNEGITRGLWQGYYDNTRNS